MIVSSIGSLAALPSSLATPSYSSLATSSPGVACYRHCARASLNDKRPSARVNPRRERASYISTNYLSYYILLFPPYSFPLFSPAYGDLLVYKTYVAVFISDELAPLVVLMSSIMRTTFYLRVENK